MKKADLTFSLAVALPADMVIIDAPETARNFRRVIQFDFNRGAHASLPAVLWFDMLCAFRPSFLGFLETSHSGLREGAKNRKTKTQRRNLHFRISTTSCETLSRKVAAYSARAF